jgi:Na+-transporting NADH:ubiquinone oxidoreductase subunit E
MILAAETAGQGGLTLRLVVILVSAALTNNIILTRFLGMCPFLAVSRQLKAATGLGMAVVFVNTCTCVLNAALYRYVLMPLGLHTSLTLILFIVVIAAFVQLMEMLIERFSLGLYYALGIFLPLITVNCAILDTSLFMVNLDYNVVEATVFGFGGGVGWLLAICALAGIRERIQGNRLPAGLEGPAITLIITAIMALAFVGFSGMIQ